VDVLNIAAGVTTVGAFLLASWQYAENRNRSRTERERILLQRERLRAATSAAVLGAEAADYIVQRCKDPDVGILEVQSIARVMRGDLAYVAEQLRYEERLLGAPRPAAFRSYRGEKSELEETTASPNRSDTI
jgi:hypothetical protein